MSAHADIAWSRQLSGMSRGQIALWSAAAALALSVHVTAAWLAMRQPDALPVLEASSAAIEIDLAALGFSSADQLAAGEVAETAEPVTTTTTEAVTQTTEAVEAQQTPPVETTQPERTERVEPVRPVETATAPETPPVRPETVEPVRQPETPPPAEPVRPVEAAPAEEQRPVATPQAEPSPVYESTAAATEAPVAAAPPVETEEAEEAETAPTAEVETVQPVEEEEQEVAELEDVPLPTPRPEYTPPPTPRVERPRAEPQRRVEQRQPPRQAQRTPPRQSGSGGQNQADSRRGIADGSTQGRSATRSQGGQRGTTGNAAVSNYPGQVTSRLRRSLRYPAEARRQRLRGEVHVSFTVNKSGGVSSVRVARSSGSPVLDNAALETVRRAAPFPPIPDGAGRSSWPFTVPLAFTR